MIERLTPEEYERQRVTDTSAQNEWLDSQLAEERKLREYVYGAEPEPEPEEPEPQIQYIPIGVENAEKAIPWGLILIGTLAVTGIIALSIVAIVGLKK